MIRNLLSTFSKWRKEHPIEKFFIVISSLQGCFWVLKCVIKLLIGFVTFIVQNEDTIISVLKFFENLVSSLIYEKQSLIHRYKRFFV